MQPNPVRQRLLNGQTVFGIMAFEFFTPGLAQIMTAAGAEFLIVDTEHSGAGIETIKAQMSFARGLDIAPIVRVPGCEHHLIAPILDAGAMGIMVPLVETAEQARQIADACRYRPEGRRGLAFGVAHDDYATTDMAESLRQGNERTLVIALIESETGIANADEILAVPGIDVGWLGHYDLTDSMGIPGQFEDPRFAGAVDRLATACRNHGKAAGFMDADVDMVRSMMAKGFRTIGYGTDVALLQSAYRSGLAQLRAKP